MTKIIVIAHNIRSSHNIGALFRLCDGVAVDKIFLTGYSPHPRHNNDKRLPHLANKIDSQIHKTALGAEKSIAWDIAPNLKDCLMELKADGYNIMALEQSSNSQSIESFQSFDRVAVLIGNEVEGLDDKELLLADRIIEIPMLGKKESHNVITATAMLMYKLRFH